MNVFSKVEEVLTDIRPYLQKDGGDIKLVSVEDGVARVQFQGYCTTCNHSMMTLNAVSAIIMEKVPEIHEVVE